MNRPLSSYLGWIVTILLCGVAKTLAGAPTEYVWLEEECPLEFNVSGRVRLPQPLPSTAKAKIVLNYRSPDDHYVVAFVGRELKALKVEGGKIIPLWPSRELPTASEHSLVIKRRAHRLAVVVDGKLMGQAPDEAAPGGRLGSSVGEGIPFDPLSVQEVEPVYFTDDFMRTADQMGVWEPVCGKWKVKVVDSVEPDPARSANPFSFGVTAPERAVAVAGYGFWDSYLYQVAVKPEAPGTVGLVVFYQDPQNYVLFRWSSHDPAGDTQARQLVWCQDGQEHVAGVAGGGYQPGQWYQLMLQATDSRVEAFIDGQSVLTADSPPFCSGAIGLYAEKGLTAAFDDVLCCHWESSNRVPSGPTEPPRITPQFTREETMSNWANPESEWAPGENGWRWNRGVFWGDAWLAVDLPALEGPGAQAVLAIHATSGQPESGYVLSLTATPDRSSISGVLSRQGKEWAREQWDVKGWPIHVELRRDGPTLLVEVDGERMLAAEDTEPLPGTQTGIQTLGVTVPAQALGASGTHCIDDTFATAPTRWWQGKGNWHVASRWSCQPGWTWLIGTESTTPVLWSKRAFGGDFTVEAFVSNRMDLPNPPGYSHPGDLNVTVCGDGRSVNSGYSFLFAGWNNTSSGLFRQNECITRNGKAVLLNPANTNPQFHRHWFRLRVERRGHRLRHWVDEDLISEYEDPNPLPSGRVALWTCQNNPARGGLVVARVRVWYEREAAAEDFPPLLLTGEESNPREHPLEPVPEDTPLVQQDFETEPTQWSGYNRRDGAIVSLDETTAASGKRSLKVGTVGGGGDFTVWAGVGPFDALKLRTLRFAYRVPSEVKVNLYLQMKGRYYAIEFTGGPQPPNTCKTLGQIEDVVTDNQWHRAEFDLGTALQAASPESPSILVSQMCFSAPKDTYYLAGLGGNGWGVSYHLDDFELRP